MIVRELEVKYKKGKKIDYTFDSPEKVHEYFRDIIGNECQEHFVAIYLDIKNKINGWIKISIGTLNETIVHPRDIFKTALITNSASIILCHNHPSGDTKPSKEDLATTKRIKDGAKILGLTLLDHVIITGDKFLSFEETNRL